MTLTCNRGYADVRPAPAPYPITVPWLNLGIALTVPAVAARRGGAHFAPG